MIAEKLFITFMIISTALVALGIVTISYDKIQKIILCLFGLSLGGMAISALCCVWG